MKSINKFLVVMLCFVLFTTMAFALSACIEKELKIAKIEVSGPSETAVGEFDYNDYTVKVIFDDGSTKDIKLNKDLLSASDRELLDTPGTHTITVQYNDVTCTFTVTIKGDGESQDKGIRSIAISGPNEIVAGDIDYSDFSLVITYEDDSTTTIELREEFILEEDRAKLNTVGSHSISITYNGTTTTWNITVKENESTGDIIFEGVTFEDATYIYDGREKSIEVNGVPDGATVKYNVSNSYTNAGVYPIEATISKEGYKTLVLTATLTINKATYDMSGVEFDDKTVVYNGEVQRIEISGSLPQGVTVSYENNENINVGTYEVVAKFTGDHANYNVINDKTAQLIINKATYDMSSVKFVDKTVVYNGKVQRIEISGTLPQGVTVSYENNENINVGTYEVVAKFTGDSNNYEAIADITATLTIDKATYDMSSVEFADKTVIYNGEVQRLAIRGTLPQGVTVSYENNGNINVGTYTVTAKFTGDSNNYEAIADMTATLTIKEAKETEGLMFEKINNDTEYSVVGYEGEDSDIVILSTHEGLPVTTIGYMAFYGCSGLTSITIPESVTSIGNNAFYNCSGLTIYCEVSSKPDGWDSNWNYSNCPVVWDCNNNEIAEDGYIYAIIDSIRYGLKDGEAYVAEQSKNISGELVIKDKVSYKAQEYIVTSITHYAFDYCSGLTSITIGNSVTSIGYRAFEGCSGLTSITIPDSVTSIGSSAFSGCSGLTSITVAEGNSKYYSRNNCIIETVSKTLIAGCKTSIIPDDGSVTSIGDSAFEDCSGLTSITIPDSVTSIGNSAFEYCSGLTSITIPNSVTSIGYYAFWGCSGLTSITIPDSVTSIGNWAFYNCSGLASITIPDSVTSIGDSAFEDCSGLTSITIPDSVTSIGYSAFTGCSGLTIYCEVGSKPNGWDSIWNSSNCPVVWDCNNNEIADDGYIYVITDGIKYGLKDGEAYIAEQSRAISGEVVIADKVSYKNQEYVVTSIGEDAFYYCSGLTSITIPDSVTSIGERAFYNCSGLTSITIPDSVTSIGSNAFYDCTNLTSITIPFVGAKLDGTGDTNFDYIFGMVPISLKEVIITGGTSIGNWAFSHCSGLTSITIPDSVTSIGDSAFYSCSELTDVYYTGDIAGWCNIQFVDITSNPMYYADNLYIKGELVTDLVIPDNVTSIGNYTFYNCSGLASITIPDSVTSIGSYAFYNCSRLTSIAIPNSVTSIGWNAFYNCTNLTSITIPFVGEKADGADATYFGFIFGASSYKDNSSYVPESLREVIVTGGTGIGNYAFYNCSGLTSITIPDSVTSIGSIAFYNCSGLIDVYYTGDIAGWCNIQFGSGNSNPMFYANNLYIKGKLVTDLVIPDSVTIIGNYTFYKCSGFTSVTISDSVTSIGDYAFSGCSGFTSIAIPDSVTSIGESAFRNCTGLTNVTIPDSVTSIGQYAFEDCSGLTSIAIPDSVTSIGNSAFEYCSGLTSITIPDSVKSIGDSAFEGCSGLTSITIPDSVTSIGSYVFSGCSGLTSITIPDDVTSIGDRAFAHCSGLTSITIPDSVTSIGSYAFYNCSGLTSITIGNSVTSIGQSAFYYCGNLTNVTFNNTQGWWYSTSSSATSGTSISSSYLADPATAATYLTSTYYHYYWKRS